MRCSLIIPAYNAEKTIAPCLESALNQSLERNDYEIIVVDDGSTDKTSEIVKEFPVHLIWQENQGPAAARNNRAYEAKGSVLVFTDSDCELGFEFLERMIGPIENNPEIIGVQGTYKTEQVKIVARFAQIEIEQRYAIMQKNKYIDFIGTYAAAYRKDIFLKMGGFDTTFPMASGEDSDFSYRLSRNGYKMVFNSKAFVYHKHPEALREYLRQKYWRGYWRNRIYRKNLRKAIKDSYTPQVLKFQILIAALMGSSILSSPIFKETSVYVLLLLFAIFVLSCLPFGSYAFSKDVTVGLLSPLLLFGRTCALLVGIVVGLTREILLKKQEFSNPRKISTGN